MGMRAPITTAPAGRNGRVVRAETHPRLKPNRDDQIRAIRLFVKPGETHELKRWKPSPEKVNVRGDDDDATLLAALEKLGDQAHLTLNPIAHGTTGYATNDDVVRRRWLVLDCDVQRRGEASSTDEEKAEAYLVAGAILDHLLAEGLPEGCSPAWVDSGNGWRLHFPIDLPADPESDDLVKRTIKAVAARFDTDAVKIDTNLGTAVKCCRIPGSVVAKGDDEPDRPHRVSCFHDMGGGGVAPEDFLRKIAGPKPSPTAGLTPGAFVARAMGDDRKAAWIEAGIEKELARLAAAPENTRNILLNEVSFILGTLAGAAPEYEQEIRHRLTATAQGLGLPDREIASTIRSGFEDGKAKPRQFPDTIIELPSAPPKADVKVELPSEDPGDEPEPGADGGGRELLTNYGLMETRDDEGRAKKVRVPLSASEIDEMHDAIAGDRPYRVVDTLFVPGADYRPVYLKTAAALFAYYDDLADVRWSKSGEVITEQRWFERRKEKAPRFDAIETRPHFPAVPNVFYLHPEVPASGGGMLRELAEHFSPETPFDLELIEAMILTWFWGGEPGRRPVFLLTGPKADREMGRGVGKSTAPQLLADELLEGFIDASNTEDAEVIKTRLLSSDAGRKRVAIVDNLKTHRFSNAGIEGFITSPTISGRALYVGEGSRPNLLNWVITVNGASLSKDMAQRSIVVRLARPKFDPTWEEQTRGFIRSNLWRIVADVRDRLALPSPLVKAASRWAAWERDVLGKLPSWEALQGLIMERQREIDSDDDERATIADAIREKIEGAGRCPDRDKLFIPNAVLYGWVEEATRRRWEANRIVGFILGLSIPNLRKTKVGSQRGWVWTGDVSVAVQAEHIREWIWSGK